MYDCINRKKMWKTNLFGAALIIDYLPETNHCTMTPRHQYRLLLATRCNDRKVYTEISERRITTRSNIPLGRSGFDVTQIKTINPKQLTVWDTFQHVKIKFTKTAAERLSNRNWNNWDEVLNVHQKVTTKSTTWNILQLNEVGPRSNHAL